MPESRNRNQIVLANMKTQIILRRVMQQHPVSEPFDLLMSSIDEAIIDAKERLKVLVESGLVNAATELQEKIFRWESSRNLNR